MKESTKEDIQLGIYFIICFFILWLLVEPKDKMKYSNDHEIEIEQATSIKIIDGCQFEFTYDAENGSVISKKHMFSCNNH